MKKTILATLFLVLNGYSNTTEYFPADLTKNTGPTIQFDTPFDSTNIDISLMTRRPMAAVNSLNQAITLPAQTRMTIQATLDQMYEGFRQPLIAESFLSRDPYGEYLTINNPETLKLKSILSELIQLKMQERTTEYFGSKREKKELVEVRVKKEGELKEEIVKIEKSDLKKAIDEDAVEVEEEDIYSTKLPTDYNGKDTWSVAQVTEAKDIFNCQFCTSKKDDVGIALAMETANQLIQRKYGDYSKDSKTTAMVEIAKRKKRDPAEYAASQQRWCYKYVKNALLEAKLTSKRLDGVSARFAGTQLKEHGFINIMDDPELAGKILDPAQAPKGAILVYEPNPANRLVSYYDKKKKKTIVHPDHGHVEIKTEDVGKPGYVSDYFSKNARTGKSLKTVDRKLVGIYVKN
jgi:hypothetical protein